MRDAGWRQSARLHRSWLTASRRLPFTFFMGRYRPLAVPGGCERTLLSRFLLHQHSKTRRELLQERGLRGCGPGGPAAGGSEGRAAGLAVEGRARGGERGAAPATCRRGARERARRNRLRAEAAVRTRSCDERGACRGARLCGQRGEEGRGQEVARWPPPAAKRAKKGQLRWWAGCGRG